MEVVFSVLQVSQGNRGRGHQLAERGGRGIGDLKRDVNSPMRMLESKRTRGIVGLSDT